MDGGDGGEKELNFSLYFNANLEDKENEERREIPQYLLEEAIRSTNPVGPWRVTKTGCGLIAAFTLESDSLALLNTSLAEALGGPVQVARFSSRDSRYKQVLILRDVPWAVPLQEIRTALEHMGIVPLNLERIRQNVKVEVNDPFHYENLLRFGLDFFGATRFTAYPDRWRSTMMSQRNSEAPSQHESVLQCYRCQGFWHIAANCHHMPRCVRCGEGHSVEQCTRPRNDPVCCHCNGPHHAAYRQCPIRLQLAQSTPVTLTLSTSRLNTSKVPWTPGPPNTR